MSDGEQALRSLARDGFAAARGSHLKNIAEWCQVRCDDSGDGRFCILAGILLRIYEWWDDWGESVGGVPFALVAKLEETLSEGIPLVLDSISLPQAARSAAALREEVDQFLLPEKSWGPWMTPR